MSQDESNKVGKPRESCAPTCFGIGSSLDRGLKSGFVLLYPFFAFLLVFALTIATGCGSAANTTAKAAEERPSSRVAVLRPQSFLFEQTVSATGSLLADEEAQISLKVAGRIQSFAGGYRKLCPAGHGAGQRGTPGSGIAGSAGRSGLGTGGSPSVIAPGGETKTSIPSKRPPRAKPRRCSRRRV